VILFHHLQHNLQDHQSCQIYYQQFTEPEDVEVWMDQIYLDL
jgi:hypothetical protein